MVYDSKKIKELLREGLKKDTCKKHPVSVVIETIKGEYVLGWNGPLILNGKKHSECYRKDYPSGQGLELCPNPIDAERRAIFRAAKYGISLSNGTIFLSEWFPCETCAASIVESGLTKLVTPDDPYLERENHVLMPKLRNQTYNFENTERLLVTAGIEIIVDSSIRP